LPAVKELATLAVGASHSCAIGPSGNVVCRGNPANGRLGDMGVETQGPFKTLAAGRAHTCGIRETGELVCWGDDGQGQAPNPSQEKDWVRLTAFEDRTCAIRTGGDLRCFGAPYDVDAGFPSFKANEVATGGTHTCAVSPDGGMYCMGNNTQGALGLGEGISSLPDFTSVDSAHWRKVCAGADHTCGLRADGTLWCWGLGNRTGSTNGNEWTPHQSSEAKPWLGLTCGSGQTCVWNSDGELWCLGENPYGQLGQGDLADHGRLVRVRGTWRWAAAGSGGHMCAERDDGGVACWGEDGQGAVSGVPTNVSQPPATPVGGGGHTQVVAGAQHACAATDAGNVECWGLNTSSQVDFTDTRPVIPTPVQPISDAVSHLGAAVRHSCAANQAGVLLCWGDGSSNQLGGASGANNMRTTIDVRAMALGESFTCVVTSTEALRCSGAVPWATQLASFSGGGNGGDGGVAFSGVAAGGEGVYGVADGQALNLVPQDAGLALGPAVSAVAVGGAHTCVIRSDGGAVECWGDNSAGALGGEPIDGGPATMQNRVRAAHGGTVLSASSICCGGAHTCVVSRDDKLWCWGANDWGQLGRGVNPPDPGTPNAVDSPPGTVWKSVSCGREFTCATEGSGGVFCWGANNAGQLGNGRGPVLSPEDHPF
jgi:alpha-tubulin suppressor-like RCC1 family protein